MPVVMLNRPFDERLRSHGWNRAGQAGKKFDDQEIITEMSGRLNKKYKIAQVAKSLHNKQVASWRRPGHSFYFGPDGMLCPVDLRVPFVGLAMKADGMPSVWVFP